MNKTTAVFNEVDRASYEVRSDWMDEYCNSPEVARSLKIAQQQSASGC
jgi:hypothetical protein